MAPLTALGLCSVPYTGGAWGRPPFKETTVEPDKEETLVCPSFSREGLWPLLSLRPPAPGSVPGIGRKSPLSLGPKTTTGHSSAPQVPEFLLQLPDPQVDYQPLTDPQAFVQPAGSSRFPGFDCSAVQSHGWVTRGLHLGFLWLLLCPRSACSEGHPRGRLADACLSPCLSPSCPH